MKWNHLPVVGGLYDQHPDLLEQWDIIFQAQSAHDRAEDAKQKSKTMSGKPTGRGRKR